MQLAGKLTAFNFRQRYLLIQPVASEKLSRPLEQKPRGNPPLAGLENTLSGRESPGLGVGEALDDLELFLAKPRKTLGAPIGERHHDLDLLWRSHFDSSIPQRDLRSSLRFSERTDCRSNGKVCRLANQEHLRQDTIKPLPYSGRSHKNHFWIKLGLLGVALSRECELVY